MTDQRFILHLGLGAFHRAHQAVYMHRLMEQGDVSWALVAGNLRPDNLDTIAALQTEGGAYPLETVSPTGERRTERITSIQRIIAYEPSQAGLIDVGADRRTCIISFTVTEAGYYLDSRNRLVTDYPDLASDLAGATRGTIYGALAAILGERMKRDSGPVTLLNCDNLRNNGERFRAGLLDFLARRHERALLAWVEANTTCPSSMVDRITPRPKPMSPLMAEEFMQWVIEDHFCSGRPAWERVGAQMVDSVLPYEEAKIRILNASHCCFAWAGMLIGLHYVHEDVAHPTIRRMAYDYITDEAIPCLHTPARPSPIDLASYRDMVLHRFSNPHLADTNQRVAMDGFAKIPGFVRPTLSERLARDESIIKTAKLAALFFELLSHWHRGELAGYQDQGMDEASVHEMFDAPDPLAAYCRDPVLWGPLAGNERLAAAITAAHQEVLDFLDTHRHAWRLALQHAVDAEGNSVMS